MVDLAAQIFRDYNTDGDPGSGPHKPVKADIRAWGTALEGGDFTQDIDIAKANPKLTLNKAASGQSSTIYGQTAGLNRISVSLGSGTAESGANAGSDFWITRYDDAGAGIDVPFQIRRSDGLVILGDGLNLGAVGQVAFPATQAPSASANTLDDYEEGTFTPRIIGTGTAGTGTYSVQVGRYTKIGDRVIGEIEMVWSAHTGTTNMKIADLPFTGGARKSPVSLSFSGLTFAAALHGYVEASATTIALFTSATGAAETALPIDTAATLRASFTYSVN